MAEDAKDQDTGTQDQEDQDTGTQEDQDTGTQDQEGQKDQDQKDSGKKELDPEVKRAIQRRDRALKEKQALADQLKALRDKYEPEKADPVKVANRRLVVAESRTVMAAAGLTEKEDQAALATFLDLDSVTVDDDGTVDSDTIQERLEKLVQVVGKLAKKGSGPKVPRVDSRDRGGEKAAPKDAQSQRRRELLGYR